MRRRARLAGANSARCASCCSTWARSNVVEEKTRLPANYAQLGVEDVSSRRRPPARASRCVSPARSWALIVGKPSSAKSGYVRVANSAQSLLAAPAAERRMPIPKAGSQRSLLDLPAERVREIEQRPLEWRPTAPRAQKKEDANFTVDAAAQGPRAEQRRVPRTCSPRR